MKRIFMKGEGPILIVLLYALNVFVFIRDLFIRNWLFLQAANIQETFVSLKIINLSSLSIKTALFHSNCRKTMLMEAKLVILEIFDLKAHLAVSLRFSHLHWQV